jgi:hypothetical protein
MRFYLGGGQEDVVYYSWNACKGPYSNITLLSITIFYIKASNNLYPFTPSG